MKLFRLIFKNLARNKIRTVLTACAVVFLVAIFSMVLTVLLFLDAAMAAKNADVPLVLTERYRIPSRFDVAFLERIRNKGSAVNSELSKIDGFHGEKSTLWHFTAFTLDPQRKDRNLEFMIIATEPDRMIQMIDGLEEMDPKLIELMKKPPKTRRDNVGIVIGPDRLQKLNKQVGDVFKAISMSHRDGSKERNLIEMEFEIVGELPATSRWAQGAFMDYTYLDRVLKEKNSEYDGKIMLGWLKVDNQASASKVGGIVEEKINDIKCETGSSAVGRFLEAYKSLLNGMRYLLIPAITVVMMVIVANAISITVRERTREMAVLKVLGFSAGQILFLILGEAMLLGILGGLFGAGITYVMINHVVGGIKIPIAFFPVFFVPAQILWWGPALGVLTAFLGGIVPALSAGGVKVSEVFSKVT